MAGSASSGGRNDFALARYNSDGTLDASFGTGGKVTTDFGGANDHGQQRGDPGRRQDRRGGIYVGA